MPLDLWHDLELHAVALQPVRRPAALKSSATDAAGRWAIDRATASTRRVKWGDILMPHGWRVYHTAGDVTYWTRPGKGNSVSASTGHCRGRSGFDLLYVFSTNAVPFEAEVSYSRFAAYALLNHRGDFATATKALARAGYGVGRKAVRA